MAEWMRKRAVGVRRVAWGGIAMLLSALASGCTTSNTSNAALTTSGVAATGPTIAFDSIDGPPPGVFNRLVDNLSSEAQSRNLAIASRTGAANYRVRGYMAAQVVRGRTHISWVWDVYDDDKLRTLRIIGEEAGNRGGDPWSAADEQMLHRISRTSMDRLASFLANPAAPLPPDATTAVAASDEPEPAPAPRKRRARTAAAEPTAAEKLALAAFR